MIAEAGQSWRSMRLSDRSLFEIANGIWTGKKPPFRECDVVRNTNFQNDGRLNLSKVARILIEERQFHRKRLHHGDIIVERSGGGPTQPVGRVVLFDAQGDFCFSNFTSRIRIEDGTSVDSKFLLFCLLRLHQSGGTESLQRRTTGIRNLAFNDYLNIELPLPPLKEQRAIVRALRAVQAAKDARRREIELERERKAAVVGQFFTEQATKPVKIGDLVTDLGSGVTPRGGEATYLKEGIPLIRSQNVQMNRLDLSDVAFISETTHKEMARSTIRPGDVLLNITGASIGRVACVPPAVKEANVNQHVCRMRFGTGVVPQFVSQYLASPNGQSQIMGSQFGTTRQGLNYGNVRAIRIPMLDAEEQQRIADALAGCDRLVEALKAEIELLDELFRAMLEELMSGRLSARPLIEFESAA